MPASPFTMLWSFILPVLWSSVQPGHKGRCWGATEQPCTGLRGKRILQLSCFQKKDQQAAIGRESQKPSRPHQEYQLLLKDTTAEGCHEFGFKENGRVSKPRFHLPHSHSVSLEVLFLCIHSLEKLTWSCGFTDTYQSLPPPKLIPALTKSTGNGFTFPTGICNLTCPKSNSWSSFPNQLHPQLHPGLLITSHTWLLPFPHTSPKSC